jgi:hypothetical protein
MWLVVTKDSELWRESISFTVVSNTTRYLKIYEGSSYHEKKNETTAKSGIGFC